MIQAGKIWLENGKIVPAYIEVTPEGALYVRTSEGHQVVTFTKKEIIELNREWLENELSLKKSEKEDLS